MCLNLILSLPLLQLPLLVLLHVLLVFCQLLLQLLLKFTLLINLLTHTFFQTFLLPLGLMDFLLHLPQLSLLALNSPVDIVTFLCMHFIGDPQVLHLLFQGLLTALLGFNLRALLGDSLFGFCYLLLGACSGRLQTLELLKAASTDALKHLQILAQHVAVLFKLLLLRPELAHCMLLLCAHANALLKFDSQIPNLSFELCNGFLGLTLSLR
mmetsp:Transcript_17443/g.38190  ORF Transcript_17443/g.38190 Transcript_17443/m.38190 type:complete len:211 (+) Transcript_17443:1604-2236(+)